MLASLRMRVGFPYPNYQNIQPMEIPDRNLLGIFSPRAFREVDEPAELERGFSSPIGATPLSQAAKGSQSALILIDDATRATPTARILPYVLRELHAGGMADDRIEFLQAPGTHRPMKEDELREKLGDCFGKYKVHEHHYKDRSQLHVFGKTRDGTPVTANKLLTRFDFILGIGAIVPHRVKGLSGGAKIVFPGVSGPEMMDRNQWEASMHMSETVMGVP
ncbi:MAG: lactate racemase domain-containing protein, partial [Bacillota bacterium]